jgi:pimeloyl-ACP methyl ester carboxylesterase/class 3 adenylate cyclase
MPDGAQNFRMAKGLTRYARSGRLHVAYQVHGEGPRDLVFAPGFVSNVELWWEEPILARFFERLTSFTRLVLFDKRGTGLSDRPGGVATLEERMDDVRAVMEAVGSERAAILGASEGASMAILFAATYPERTTALALFGGAAELTGVRLDNKEALVDLIGAWGTGVTLPMLFPSRASDPRVKEWWRRWERLSVSPGALADLFRMNSMIDVRGVLPAIRCPTLIAHARDDTFVPVEKSRFLASQIAGARYVELEGSDHAFCGDAGGAFLEELEEFLTGVRRAPEPDRLLATVLFIDMVASTARAADLGDEAWSDLMRAFYERVRRELERFRGREIDTAGDGVFAAFDGPARAVRCATAIVATVSELGIQVRAGLHTGECQLVNGKISGIAVATGARVASVASEGEILVTRTVTDLVAGSGLAFKRRGTHALKGVPGEWELFAVAT